MSQIRFKSLYFGDWSLATQNMSHQQVGIFTRLMTLYFSNAAANNGKLDASDFDLLCWQVGCCTDSEISDLRLLLRAKFKKVGKTYRHADWDKEIKAIQWEIKKGNAGNVTGNVGNGASNAQGKEVVTDGNGTDNVTGNGTPLTGAERTARCKERKRMVEDLINKGIFPSDKLTFAEVVTLHETHFPPKSNAQGKEVVTDGNGTDNAGNAQKPSKSINHKPITNNHKLNNISPQTPQGEASEHEQTRTFETAPQTTSTGNAKNTAPKMFNVSFDEFWDLYDKKQDRPKCERLWSKLKDQERLDIMAYIPKYKQAQPDKQYRKNPQTFLNNRSWENELVTATANKLQTKQSMQFGGVDDPLAVNQHWKDYPTPANWEENLAKLMAEGQNHKSGLVEI